MTAKGEEVGRLKGEGLGEERKCAQKNVDKVEDRREAGVDGWAGKV